MTLVSCDLDRGDVAVVDSENIIAPKLTQYPTEALVLDKLIADTQLSTFAWDKAEYGYSAAATYSLEAVYNSNVAIVAQTTEASITVDGDALNTMLVNNLGVGEGEEATISFRIRSSLSADSKFDATSEAILFTITTFSGDAVEMYTVGSHQGWDASNGVPIYSEKGNGVYVGWVWLYNMYDDASPAEYVFLSVAGDWSSKIGSVGDDTNTIDNLMIGEAASNISSVDVAPSLYYISLDVPNVSGEYLYKDITTIGLIGDATPGGWDSDTDLVYDPDSKTFVATGVAMEGGLSFKVRANDEWSISWGGGAEAGTLCSLPEGDNITFDMASGTYTVVVDMFKFNPTYEFIAE